MMKVRKYFKSRLYLQICSLQGVVTRPCLSITLCFPASQFGKAERAFRGLPPICLAFIDVFQTVAFWLMTQCGLVDGYQNSGEIYCFQFRNEVGRVIMQLGYVARLQERRSLISIGSTVSQPRRLQAEQSLLCKP
jgi:hypothetical protein